jgi:hypothetical protein
MLKRKRFVEYCFIVVGLILFVVFVARAMAQDVAQGYLSDTSLQLGMVVEQKPGDPSRVQPLGQKSEANMLGVVVAPNDAPVSLSNNEGKNQVYVATYGQYDVLVSSQNGTINVGDTIAISALDGVGMKSDDSRASILGKAIESFDGKGKVQSTAQLKTSLGGTQTVAIGRIAVDVNVAHNPAYNPPVTTPDGVPNFLAEAAQIVTNKPVGALRIYSSLAILVVTVIISGILLYSGVRTSMIAIGRNPLAKRSILRNLLQVVLIGMIILIIGLIAVYLLLKI